MTEQPKIAGFAVLDDFHGDVLRKLGTCLYNQNIIPIAISLKKGRNVVQNLKNHGPFRTLVKKMLGNNQLVVAIGKALTELDEIKMAKGQSNLITADSLKDFESVCEQVTNRLKRAA